MNKHPEISPLRRWWRLHFAKRTPGVCRVCGCTNEDPCYNPDYGCCWWDDEKMTLYYGCCWWADEKMTLCSHCAEKSIALDPRTKRCVNSNRPTDL